MKRADMVKNRKVKLRDDERRAIERCILRTLREACFAGDAGRMDWELQSVLYGLEKARRAIV